MLNHLAVFVFAVATLPAAEPTDITIAEADARLRRAYALGRETNDQGIVDKVLEYRDGVKRAFGRRDFIAARRLVRDAEEIVGLDAGGESMAGLPVARIEPSTQKQLDGLQDEIKRAMNAGNLAKLSTLLGDASKLLGPNAGLPDARRKGDTITPEPTKPKEVAELFLKVVQVDPRSLKALSSGKPVGDTLPRGYAVVVDGCLIIRPTVEKEFPTQLETLDGLIRGCCSSLIALQVDKGYFKFPDLRGKHMVFGDAIERFVSVDPEAVENGWVILPDPDGGSQFDAGESGMALLRAGRVFKNDEWTQAGLKAANWAMHAPLVPNFNYNAFSVSLLCEAYRATNEQKYLDAARRKYELGVAPGQIPNGRWLDPHNARTVNHLVLLRACHDLLDVLPAGKDRDSVEASARLAMQALVEEGKKLGVPATSSTVIELDRHARLVKNPPKEVREFLEVAATAAIQRCSSGERIRPGAPLPELAGAARVWTK